MCVSVLSQLVLEKDKVIDESFRQTETLRRGMIIHFLVIISVHPFRVKLLIKHLTAEFKFKYTSLSRLVNHLNENVFVF